MDIGGSISFSYKTKVFFDGVEGHQLRWRDGVGIGVRCHLHEKQCNI